MAKTRDNLIWTPKALLFREYYLNPKSTTFWNIRGSAIRAGYNESYANNLSGGMRQPKWWIELREEVEYRRAKMVSQSEKNMERVLTLDDDDGKDKNILDAKLKTSFFVSERLAKEAYSTRQEVTGADGRRLFDDETRKETVAPLNTLFKGIKATDSK